MNNNKKAEYLCYNGITSEKEKHNHLKLKIGVCGASETSLCGIQAYDIARELGKEIIRQGGILVTSATAGFSLWSAMGAKEEKGVSIGISPAANEKEHVEVYRLSVEHMDLIIYTGFGFSGSDLLFTRSCDAIIIGCGDIKSIHELIMAFEDGKPVGVLEGELSTSNTIKTIISYDKKSSKKIIFEKDIKILVKKIIEMTQKVKR